MSAATNLSIHPARAIHRRLPPSAETSEFLRFHPLTQEDLGTDRLPPSLHGNYPASSLLWRSPNLAEASVFWPRGVPACAVSLPILAQVPYESLDQSHAPFTPDTAWPVSRLLPCCSWNGSTIPVLVSSRSLSGIAYLPRLTLRLAGLVCELRRTACYRVGGL